LEVKLGSSNKPNKKKCLSTLWLFLFWL